jgi:flagellar hook-associated protein 3 FlgL
MNRVSTVDGWNSALLNLMGAQRRQAAAQEQVSSEKQATDLQGFGRSSETLAAFKSAQTRLQGYIDTGKAVGDRLTQQDLAMTRTADAAQSARQAIADALGSGQGDGLMLVLQQNFQQAVDGLNTRHQGRYLFGGGRNDVPPVLPTTLAALTAGPPISDQFQNGELKAASQVDDGPTPWPS